MKLAVGRERVLVCDKGLVAPIANEVHNPNSSTCNGKCEGGGGSKHSHNNGIDSRIFRSSFLAISSDLLDRLTKGSTAEIQRS